MPRKNTVKTYVPNSYYHVYNRGVDKREIFLDEKDCAMFIYFLKTYLTDPQVLQSNLNDIPPRLMFKLLNRNLFHEVKLLSFALMPNHFHFQLKQITQDGIEKLMRRVVPSYVQYFNKKYGRIGPLFESIYKAVMTETDAQHLYLSSYIHRNPMKLIKPRFDYVQFSSYPYYLGHKHADWITIVEILSFFKTVKGKENILSYQNFVEFFNENPDSILGELVLEAE